MTIIESLVASHFAKALGWSIFHSLWEGALIALFVLAAMRVARSANGRYASACAGLAALAAAFGVTLCLLLAEGSGTTTPAAFPFPPAPAAAPGGSPASAIFRPLDSLPWLAPFWITGVALFHLWSFSSWMAARRLYHRGACLATDVWCERLLSLSGRIGVTRTVALFESLLAKTPAVIGTWRPVILVPAGMLTGMTSAQIEAILLHELAHVRRWDYGVNLAQTLVEGFLFYHPAAWWISSVIRSERENCCDDIAAGAMGNPHVYAAALAALEQNRWAAHDVALAAAGGSLPKRIQRLLSVKRQSRIPLSPAVSAGVLAVTAAFTLTAWQSRPGWTNRFQPAQRKNAPEARRWRQWLNEDVLYIITPEERAAFLRLKSESERQHFVAQFWLRRDPDPSTARNEFREEHYRRIAFANQHFAGHEPGWKTDRGRIYILYGPPDEIESHPTGGPYRAPVSEGGGQHQTFPFEAWLYHHIAGRGNNVIMEFVDKTRTGDYVLAANSGDKYTQ